MFSSSKFNDLRDLRDLRQNLFIEFSLDVRHLIHRVILSYDRSIMWLYVKTHIDSHRVYHTERRDLVWSSASVVFRNGHFQSGTLKWQIYSATSVDAPWADYGSQRDSVTESVIGQSRGQSACSPLWQVCGFIKRCSLAKPSRFIKTSWFNAFQVVAISNTSSCRKSIGILHRRYRVDNTDQ